MSEHDEQLTPTEIAERLRLAREEANKKQAEAALAIDVARTTLVAIEQGQRRARMYSPALRQQGNCCIGLSSIRATWSTCVSDHDPAHASGLCSRRPDREPDVLHPL